jgi:MFS transporter, CP family, cyanate transporter
VRRGSAALLASVSMGIVCAVLIAAVALAPVILAAATGLSVATVASLTALAALPSIIGRFLPGWLLARGSTALFVFSGAAAVSAATVAGSLAAPVPLWLAIVLFAVFQIAAGMLPGIHSAMLPHIAPAPAALGTVSGMSSQMASVGNLLGPPLVLAFYAAAGTGAAVLLLVVLLAVSVALLTGLAVFRRDLRRSGDQAA